MVGGQMDGGFGQYIPKNMVHQLTAAMGMQGMPGMFHNQQQQHQREKIENFNFDINYKELQQDYDFDMEDRPCVYPHHSYSKHIYSDNKNFSNIYSNESSAGGQAYQEDWKQVSCTNFLGQSENKHKYPLFQVKWMKGGKHVVTSSNRGRIIVWDAQNLEHFSTCDVHDDAVHAMAWTNYQKYLISGDK